MESFEEIQRAPRAMKILMLIVMGIPTLITVGGALAVSLGSDLPLGWTAMFPGFLSLTFITLIVVMLTSRLRLRIDQHGVAIRFRPFHLQDKVIRLSEITSWKVRPLSAFGEFGGWGIRWGWNKKWGYVWNGKHAVELKLRDGRTIVCSVLDHNGAATALSLMVPQTHSPTTNT